MGERNKEFAVHRLNAAGIKLAESIADIFDATLDQLSTRCMAGREYSIVKTKLEEACFFAKKAMASDPTNQEGYVPMEPETPVTK